MWSSFCCTCAPQNLMMQCYIHQLTKTKIPREKSWEEGCHNRVLHIYHGPLHTLVAVIVNLLFAIFMFLEPYELPGGPEKFESVSVLLYIIIWQVQSLRTRITQVIEIPFLLFSIWTQMPCRATGTKHINVTIVSFAMG